MKSSLLVRVAVVLAIVGVILFPSGHGRAAAQQPTFSVAVDLVSVDVLVSQAGRSVAGLTAQDFGLQDNGVPQRIESVSVETVPLDVMLVLDTSESMTGPRLRHLTEAGRAALAALRPRDRAALLTFCERTTLRAALSSDRAVAMRALDEVAASGRTSLFDALYAALSLRRPGPTRAMVLVFSDGDDNASWLGGRQALRVAHESDAVVYAVGLPGSARGDLKRIAEETGGELIPADTTEQLKSVFVRVLREMQARYVLTYYPRGVAREGWHTLSVALTDKRADVRARRGYYVPGR